MATSLGTLSVNLVANTKKLINGFNDMRKKLDEARARAKKTKESMQALQTQTQKAGSVAKTAAGSWRVLAGVLGAGALIRTLSHAASEMDNLAKTSAKLGIASENLAGLRHAASQTGVATSTLDMALQRFARRAAEAAQGTGEAQGAIRELGLDAKSLVSLPLERQISMVADSMKGLASDQDRLRVAFKLFDSEGVALVNTLRLGSDGLAKMQAEARRLGVAVSGKDLRKVEDFNDAMDRLKKVIGGQVMSIIIDISPAAVAAVNALANSQFNGGKRGTRGGSSEWGRLSGAAKAGNAILNARDNMLTSMMGGIIGGPVGGTGPQKGTRGRASAELLADAYGTPIGSDPLNAPGALAAARKRQQDREELTRKHGRLLTQTALTGSIVGLGFDPVVSDDMRKHARKKNDQRNEAILRASLFGTMFAAATSGSGSGPLSLSDTGPGKKRKTDPRQGSNDILLRGTAEAAKALRANLNREKKNPVVEINKKIEREAKRTADGIETLHQALKFEVVG